MDPRFPLLAFSETVRKVLKLSVIFARHVVGVLLVATFTFQVPASVGFLIPAPCRKMTLTARLYTRYPGFSGIVVADGQRDPRLIRRECPLFARSRPRG